MADIKKLIDRKTGKTIYPQTIAKAIYDSYGKDLQTRLDELNQNYVATSAQVLTDAQKTRARTNINAAPGGFGWGGNAVLPPNNSIDDAKATGVYYVSPSCVGAPGGHTYIDYGIALSIQRDAQVTQVYWSEASPNIVGTPLNLVRRYDGKKWYPWEWVNPPMILGVEYRTTERYLGKPVYCKVVDFGTAPNNDAKNVSLSGMNIDEVCDAIFHYYVPRNGENGVMTCHPNFTGLLVCNDVIQIRTNADRTDTNFYVTIKYTKTTD